MYTCPSSVVGACSLIVVCDSRAADLDTALAPCSVEAEDEYVETLSQSLKRSDEAERKALGLSGEEYVPPLYLQSQPFQPRLTPRMDTTRDPTFQHAYFDMRAAVSHEIAAHREFARSTRLLLANLVSFKDSKVRDETGRRARPLY